MKKNKILNLINKFKTKPKFKYPLSPNSFSNEDILKGANVLFSKNITMGSVTKRFEKEFAKFMGCNYALMVNSGSSANLLSMFALINPKKKIILNTVMSALYRHYVGRHHYGQLFKQD